MDTIIEKLPEIKEVKLITENEDNTKKYMITANSDIDLRKNIFETFAKEGITIFEMKKSDVTLEDAFMQLIENKEEVHDEVKDEVAKTENDKAEQEETDEVNSEIKEDSKDDKKEEETTEIEEKTQEENKQEEGGQE